MRTLAVFVTLIISAPVVLGGFRSFSLTINDGWLAPDGHVRAVIVFNGTLPGPELHVEEGDSVEIVVHNRMMERTTSLHVHGLLFAQQPWCVGGYVDCACAPPSDVHAPTRVSASHLRER